MTEPIANKIGVANLGTVYNQTNHITIQQGQEVALIYSDPVPDLRFFQGRGTEQSTLNGLLADAAESLIGVRGEGGIGKSTLMAKVFAESLGFAGKFWADVRTGSSMAAVAGRALQELGVPPTQVEKIEEKDLIPRLLRLLQQGRYLLAIDNLESVLTATGDWQSGYDTFLEGFQDLGSGSVLLLGSREYPPKYFGWRQSRWLTVEHGLEPTEGAALLAALEVEDTLENRVAVSVQVQGNPLALALLAGWLRQEYRPGERTVARLQQTDLWQLEGRHQGESQVSVERVLQWSIDRLPPTLQHLITQVSVLRGAFNATAAAALVPEQPVTDANLDELERRSLLQTLPERDKYELRTFRLQPRIREFVQKRADDLTAAHEKAVAFFWNHRQPQKKLLEDCREELEAFHHHCELGHYVDAYQAMKTCFNFLERTGYYSSFVPVYERLTQEWQASESSEVQNLGWAWTKLGNTYRSLGRFQDAIAAHQKAQQKFQSIVYCKGEAAALCNLGNAYQALGQYQQAIDLQEQSLIIKRKMGDRKREAASLCSLATIYDSLGQYQRALDLHHQSLGIRRELGDRRGEAASLGNLGITYDSLGQYEQSIDFHEQSLQINREFGNRQWEANSLSGLGNAYQALGQYEQSIDLLQESLQIYREIGNRSGEAASLGNLGNAYQALGQYQQAIDLVQQHNEIARELGDCNGEAKSLSNLGIVYTLLGQYQEAIDLLQQSLEINRELGDRRGEAISLGNLGDTYNSLGQYQEAIDLLQQSLEIRQEIGDRQGEVASLSNLGTSYILLGQYQEAIDLLHQSLRLAREIGDRRGQSASLDKLGIAYDSLGQSQEAIDLLQQALDIACEIGDRYREGLSLFHMGKALTRFDHHPKALQNYHQALDIFETMKLDHMVEKCKEGIEQCTQTIFVHQRSGWLQKWGLWFLVGLAIALLIWWLR